MIVVASLTVIAVSIAVIVFSFDAVSRPVFVAADMLAVLTYATFDAAPPAWGRFRPAHGAVRVMTDGAFTLGLGGGVDRNSGSRVSPDHRHLIAAGR